MRTLMPLGSAPDHPDTEMVKSFDSLLKGAFVGRHRQKVSSWELRARGRGEEAVCSGLLLLSVWKVGGQGDLETGRRGDKETRRQQSGGAATVAMQGAVL